MKEILPHISVGLDDSGRLVVIVDDYELFDFIDDYLGDECDLPQECHTSAERPGGEVITMYFSPSVTLEQLEQSLQQCRLN
ncbi:MULTISPECIES: hypothetical protein [unclassified Massilia]|uniref:hypothetical protein n=1 Tax=unclassified Massilia TaxID=2609279 RepID=UPI001B81BFD2|nr:MULTISPECIES: hypothetical protein [unclassified Massilia]MBQ5942920.1 hypothetical protein [Massilia sp. AB1]MBQ5965638.1 hypothetical protein [Massilia sp. ZL223]